MKNDGDARTSMYDNPFIDKDRLGDEQRHKFNQALTGVDLSDTQLAGLDPNMLNKAAFGRALQALAQEKAMDKLPDNVLVNTSSDRLIFQQLDGRRADDPSVPRFSVLASDLARDVERLGLQSPFEATQYQAQLDRFQQQIVEREQQRSQELAARNQSNPDRSSPSIGALT